jgi:hypothetical protein
VPPLFLSLFLYPHTLQHIYFFERQKKNKRAASRHTEQKPTPKKDGRKLFNIMPRKIIGKKLLKKTHHCNAIEQWNKR